MSVRRALVCRVTVTLGTVCVSEKGQAGAAKARKENKTALKRLLCNREFLFYFRKAPKLVEYS